MSSGFTFSFGNDNGSHNEDQDVTDELNTYVEPDAQYDVAATRSYAFGDLLPSLPATISYALYTLSLSGGVSVSLPRRELFDIRAQAMTEADPTLSKTNDSSGKKPTSDLAAGQSTDDIVRGVYEGGFKTWECALDLSRFLIDLLSTGQIDTDHCNTDIVELGAGTAVPSASVLSYCLSHPTKAPQPRLNFILADYNAPVLHLSTLPNMFLTALAATGLLLPEAHGTALDMEPSPALIGTLCAELRNRNVNLDLLAGPWSRELVEKVQVLRTKHRAATSLSSVSERPLLLILASETIYAPESLRSFASTVLELMRAARDQGCRARAFVAAKRVYFGVGGGVLEFERALHEFGGSAEAVWSSEGGGVGRCILEVAFQSAE